MDIDLILSEKTPLDIDEFFLKIWRLTSWRFSKSRLYQEFENEATRISGFIEQGRYCNDERVRDAAISRVLSLLGALK